MENSFTINLPGWIQGHLQSLPKIFATDADRMGVAVALSSLNVQHATGGPFGAAIFDLDSQGLIAVGVNRVVPCHCATAHAEMVAIALAQKALGTFDLSAKGNFQLATSCAMCDVSGRDWLVRGKLSFVRAREEDARAVGFDEGDKPANWPETLAKRNITVTQDILREQARQILIDYQGNDGMIYNPRR